MLDDENLSPQARRERAEQIAAAHGHDPDDLRMPAWALALAGVGCAVATCDR